MASKGDTEQAADGWTGSRAADQVGRKESSESHRWTCNAERPLTKAQRAYSDLAVECQVTIPADFRAAAASDRDQSVAEMAARTLSISECLRLGTLRLSKRLFREAHEGVSKRLELIISGDQLA